MKNLIGKIEISIFTIIIIFFSYSCSHNVDISSVSREICFENEVLPIFQNHCAMSGCHTGSGNGGGEQLMSLNDYNSVMETITPNDLANSLSFQVITAQNWNSIMPPDPYSPLSAGQRAIIEIWILQGAKPTTCK